MSDPHAEVTDPGAIEAQVNDEDDEGQAIPWKKSLAISGVILVAAAILAVVTFLTEPTAQREGATKKTAMLVDVVEVSQGSHRPLIVATGTVQAAEDIVLRPQVPGLIVARADEFVPGGFIGAGEMVVQLEAADYRAAVAQRQSELQQALADLAMEEGRRDAAKDEYAFLDKSLPAEKEALVLRKPQLEAARERVAAARAAVDRAQLDLRRTTVTVPFDAHVLRRDVNVGSQVSQGDSLGRLVGLDTWWVMVDLPRDKLQWIDIPDGPEAEGAPVTVRNRSAWAKGAERKGNVRHLVAAMDGQTRLARVVAEIPDPLARDAEGPALMVGEFVEATIEGVEVSDVVRLDRDLVRKDDTVWVMGPDDALKVRDVEVLLQDAEHAYISRGLEGGERVVSTNLSTVVEGAPLRVEGQAPQGGEAEGGGGDAAP